MAEPNEFGGKNHQAGGISFRKNAADLMECRGTNHIHASQSFQTGS